MEDFIANLISISQLCDQCLNVNFSKDKCFVMDKEKSLIMPGMLRSTYSAKEGFIRKNDVKKEARRSILNSMIKLVRNGYV